MPISLKPMNFIESAHSRLCHFVADLPVLLWKADGKIYHDHGLIGDLWFSLILGRNKKSPHEMGPQCSFPAPPFWWRAVSLASSVRLLAYTWLTLNAALSFQSQKRSILIFSKATKCGKPLSGPLNRQRLCVKTHHAILWKKWNQVSQKYIQSSFKHPCQDILYIFPLQSLL